MKAPALSVFEALNHSRKEIFVGVTALSLPELTAVPRDWFPAEIAHWEPSEPVMVRRLSEEMPAADAWRFSSIYVGGYIERDGWKIILQKPHD